MPDRDPDRPRRKKKKSRAATSRWFERDENGVPLWAKVGAAVITLLALIGLILKVIDRAGGSKPAPKAAVTPAQPTPPPVEQPPPAPPTTPEPPPKWVRVPIPIPPAEEIIVKITVREVKSDVPGQPSDVVVDYDYGTATPHPNKDVVSFKNGDGRVGSLIENTAPRGSCRFTAVTSATRFAGETQFWIERQESGKHLRISEIYTLRR